MNVFKPKDFAERIGVSVSTLQRWDRESIMPAKRTPTGRRYYTQSDVETYFRSSCVAHDGRWIEIIENEKYQHKCSICGAIHDYDDNFCGSCGARMVWDVPERNALNEQKEKLTQEEGEKNE